MRKISYCTTCKDRLWQLKQTLPVNILETSDSVEIIILDYHTSDSLDSYLRDNYKEYLEDGRLKYYKINTPLRGFDMAYAKHIVHLLASGDVLFNLDADNFIGSTVDELRTLPSRKILLPRGARGTQASRCGRLGISKSDYMRAGGYNIDLLGMKDDDGQFVHRAFLSGTRFKFSEDLSIPISQTEQQKMIHVRTGQYELPKTVDVVDHNKIGYIIDVEKNKVTEYE